MKQLIVLTFLLFFLSAFAVEEKSNVVVAQRKDNSNVTQNYSNSVVTQESDKFQVIVPANSNWGGFFKSINERAGDSKLSSLRSKPLPGDDMEVRVWRGFGLSLLEGFVLKRTAGQWSATNLGWVIFEERKGKREIKQSDENLGIPKSGWEAAWQKLINSGILTLPDAEGINCSGETLDGMSYVVEYNISNSYRTYMYDNPHNAKCVEAKQMLEINKIIIDEYYKREYKVEK